jgi:hypothetical protein
MVDAKFECRFSLQILNMGSYYLVVLPYGRCSFLSQSLKTSSEDLALHFLYEYTVQYKWLNNLK